MLDQISSLIINLRQNLIVKNLLALSLFQLTNYALPLLFIPYIIRVIGLEKFGLISLCQSIMILLAIVTDFGYNFISTRDIALNRNNTKELSKIYSLTLVSKLIIGLASLLILTIFTFVIPKLNHHSFLFLSGFLIVIAQLLFPLWFFQGLEKMQYITYLNFLGKLITLICIITLINTESDYLLVLPCFAIGQLTSSIIALLIIKRKFNITFISPSKAEIVASFKNGVPIFISNVSVTAYNSSSILILGLFVSDLMIGYYSAAEKLISAVRQLLSVFSQAIYPTVCKVANDGIAKLMRLWKRTVPPFLFFIFLLCILVFIFSDEIALFFTGKQVDAVSSLIRLLAFIPFIVGLNIPWYQTLLAYNLRVECLVVLITGSILNIILNLILSSQFGAMGTAISMLTTEVLISAGLFAMVVYSKKKLKQS